MIARRTLDWAFLFCHWTHNDGLIALGTTANRQQSIVADALDNLFDGWLKTDSAVSA